MGRSKFPGKPSKHVNRTRINVLCTPSNTTTVGADTNNVVTVNSAEDSKQIDNVIENDESLVTKIDEVINRKKRTRLVNKRTALKRNGILPTVSSKLSNIQVPRRTRSAVNSRRGMRNFTNIRKVSKSKHPVGPAKESNNLVGKFVLPSRSVHSSRVIKPNKRFINVESNDVCAFKKRVNKRLCIRETDEKCITTEKISATKENSDNNNDSTNSKGKVVLRQARLQLHTPTNAGPEGPFSTNTSNSVSPPGTVTCGVCGAVRFYRFVKQARKFNIYSCESCRKFISKMIKRQNNQLNSTTLVCHKGQGMCHVPPIVRSQQWKLFRCAYKARCPACWLKMCLRSFQMPIALKNSLAQLLPKNMQTCDTLFTNPLPLLSWQSNVDSNTEKAIEKSLEKASPKEEISEETVRRRPVRMKAVKRDIKPLPSVPVSEIKRQKIDLKGPRVKHVCRSASIVLGQPIATFPIDHSKRNMDSDEKCETKKIGETKDTRVVTKDIVESDKVKREGDTSSEKQNLPIVTKNLLRLEVVSKKEKNMKSTVPCVPTEGKSMSFVKKNILDHCNTISIDFWENYDPDEICKSGFGLTSSEIFPMQAICFLCGSAGQETLLHCLICCEPYHSYCLEQAPVNFIEYNEKYNWLCPRCTTCEACGQADRQKINCMKCHKSYHPNCFNSLWKRDDKPTLCSNCLRCKSCGTDSIAKFVGNFALCHVCFKLRNKGNYCPLCQKCYDDTDFDTKMMECGKCKKWVHAKCETLADEQYQILSLLPESVEFLCHLCCNQSTPFWREAIQSELKSSFNNVLKLLSKNRVARNMLKLSPYKNTSTNNKPTISVRRIQFQDHENMDVNENSKESNNKLLCRRLSFESQENLENKQEPKSPVSSTIVDIKNKLNSNEYISLQDFNMGMEHALFSADSEELLAIYRNILKEVFPWYNPMNIEEKQEITKIEIAPPTQCSLIDTGRLFDYDLGKDKDKVDNRICGLCKIAGDGLPHKEARLLYCGQNEWVHANCALWSSEVYEEIDGSLQNVHSALSRGRLIKCARCKQKGASVGCCEKGCHETYHFACALNVNCYFLHDKTVYCHSHELINRNLLTNPSDFDIRRSVYVELDRKRKKYSEADKVHFMVGSLSVTSLGKIVPVLSDDFDALVPLGFTCTRLFWSTAEPWRLIPYNISTSILNSESSHICIDKNFTVDHSLPKGVVDKKLKEILHWQKDITKEAVELEFEEEPQNTDLLTPELTDAIFEELPHDFLDGISVQDVLMYEELLNMDFKSEINYTDNNLVSSNEQPKCKDTDENDGDPKNFKELKRSKSEVFSQFGSVDKLNKNRSHQRSCSLTWSCKLDNSLAPAIKKRKINSRESNMYLQLLQVDGACDSSGSECESPIPLPMHENEDVWNYEEEPVSCERCQCTYRTRASYKRHLATCDALSTSESDSEEQTARSNCITTDANTPIYIKVVDTEEPNLITSYESYSSYQATQNEVHSTIMNTQTLVTAEASEVISVPENSVLYPTYPQQIIEQKTLPVITHPTITINDISSIPFHQPTITMNQPQTTTIEDPSQIHTNQQFCINQQPICVNQSNTLSLNHYSLDNSSILNQTNPISINPISINTTPNHTPISINQNTLPLNQVEIQQPVTIQSLPFTSDVINITPQNQITIDTKMLTGSPCTNLVNSVVAQTMAMPQNHWVKSVKPTTVITQKAIRPRAKPRSLAAKRGKLPAGSTILMPPSSSSTAPSVIVQHLPSSNMMPTYVDAFQQQSGQNVQYVATIAPQINSAIGPQTQLVQLQPDSNYLSLVPGVQPTMIIQPRVVADQLIVDGNGSMWATQPVYYGFETIVQNTVMQSQQFLPTTMNGVLTTNSSYSATTQVFQTSKLEPVLDVAQGGFVFVNSGQIVNPQPTIQMPSQISQNLNTHSHIPPVLTQQNQPAKMHSWSNYEPITTQIQEIPQQTKLATTLPSSNTNTLHSINLPVAPFVPEQGIPTNIVTPTPKPPTSAQTRPMSRVLPMQTNVPREQRKLEDKIVSEKPIQCSKDTGVITSFVKPKVTILENEVIKEPNPIVVEKVVTPPKLETQVNLLLPKPVEKSSSPNNFVPKYTQPSIQVASLKPIIPEIKTSITSVPEEKIEPTLTVLPALTEEPTFVVPELPKLTPPPSEPKIPQEKLTNTSTNSTNSNPVSNVVKNGSSVLYTVETRDGFRYSSTSIYELWSKVFDTVQVARATHNMPPLPANALDKINNSQLLGLQTNGLRYLLEQLPGARKCTKYKPNFYSKKVLYDSDDDLDVTNSAGSIRTIAYIRKKEPYDMFGWLASKHRKPENCVIDSELLPRRGSVTNLPMAMRFRQLKLTSKVSVGVYRSNIHRRGLFSLRDIESGEMVIEYAGEVIRSVLTDKREKYYNSKGIGCYMFRIDDNLVVDATMKGNAARFINHSCDPNCYSKVVEIHGHKHIIIFALRRILCGEELTYDYKFPFEEDKIPCTCGARRCRKFLN